MSILYEIPSVEALGIGFFVLFSIIAFNEFGRTTKWGGVTLFIIVPLILTFAVWPTTAAPGNEYGTGNWFNWVKTYSALAGCVGFMALRYFPSLQKKKAWLMFPPFILALNIFEAVIRDFQVYSYGAFDGTVINNLWVMSGPWNIINGIAGLLNIVVLCGWLGIFISKDKTKDMIWPDMTWAWIIAYDLWNFSYVYNCITDHSFYAGLILLLACTIPSFYIKKGAWLQHRAQTLAIWIMFIMTVPQFADRLAPVHSTHDYTTYLIVSIVSLAFNLGLAIYQFRRIIKLKLNPFKDEIYKGTKTYEKVVKANL